MADLPATKVQMSRVFKNEGLDYVDFHLIIGKGSGHEVMLEGYILKFACKVCRVG